jgi:hypothetical protein
MATEPNARAMLNSGQIDTTFDFRSDTPQGMDPDAWSPTLRRYHKLLWSKPLPNGAVFDLVDTTPRVYLHHRSQLGEFWLSSDAVIPSFVKERRISHIFDELPAEDVEAFRTAGYTIGGMMLFPGNQVDRKMTINAQRGCHPRIKDRFDLTVECIRRYYLREQSPLFRALNRYADFFALFGNFRGYVEFFLLQDLVTDDSAGVKFFLPFSGFESWPVPANIEDYKAYMRHALEFIEARNVRIRKALSSLAIAVTNPTSGKD